MSDEKDDAVREQAERAEDPAEDGTGATSDETEAAGEEEAAAVGQQSAEESAPDEAAESSPSDQADTDEVEAGEDAAPGTEASAATAVVAESDSAEPAANAAAVGAAVESAAADAGEKRQVTFAVPPVDRLLVILGAAAMVLAGLLSWIAVAPDAFPNFAGAGAGGFGVGLVVVLVGLALLSGRPRLDTANGVATGAFVASLLAVILLVDEPDGSMGAGAWLAMVGSFVAMTGIAFAAMDPSRRPRRRVTHKAVAMLGAGLAVIASFWMDWSFDVEGWDVPASPLPEPLGGLDSEVITGYPVLILGVLVLLQLLGLLSPTASPDMASTLAMNIRSFGIAITVLAAADIVGELLWRSVVGSGPILALIGALMIVKSVAPETAPAIAEPADAQG